MVVPQDLEIAEELRALTAFSELSKELLAELASAVDGFSHPELKTEDVQRARPAA